MSRTKRRSTAALIYIVPVMLLALAVAAGRGESTSGTAAPEKELTITLAKPAETAPSEGDRLRKSLRFDEAIETYEASLDAGDLDADAVKETRYNIGLCLLWLGDYDAAEADFTALAEDYPGDGDAAGYAAYCLAWMDVQRGEYAAALATLNGQIAKGAVEDEELRARLLFMTGKIHLAFLNDFASARSIFKRVAADYPGTKIAAHPWVADTAAQ